MKPDYRIPVFFMLHTIEDFLKSAQAAITAQDPSEAYVNVYQAQGILWVVGEYIRAGGDIAPVTVKRYEELLAQMHDTHGTIYSLTEDMARIEAGLPPWDKRATNTFHKGSH